MVAVAQPKAAASLGYFECQGFVYPIQRFVLKLRPGERLEAIMVAKGDRVKAGQPLAHISDTVFPDYVSRTHTPEKRLCGVAR